MSPFPVAVAGGEAVKNARISLSAAACAVSAAARAEVIPAALAAASDAIAADASPEDES